MKRPNPEWTSGAELHSYLAESLFVPAISVVGIMFWLR
jgi:hypothetical protein